MTRLLDTARIPHQRTASTNSAPLQPVPLRTAPVDSITSEAASLDTAPVDLTGLHRVLAALHSQVRAEQDLAVRDVLRSPQLYPPPALYALAHVLFQRGRSQEALFWYHAGQLRARFDVERCTDPTVVDVLALLRRQYGAAINEYAFVVAEFGVLRTAVERAVAWDRGIPHDYDQRWVNLHGLRASTRVDCGTPPSRPRSQWAALAEQIRAEYLDGTHALLRNLERYAPQGASA